MSFRRSEEAKAAGFSSSTKKALLDGGDSGPALMPGKIEQSLLIKAIRYTDPDLRMPPKKKLPAEVIADFEKWVAMGDAPIRALEAGKIVAAIDIPPWRRGGSSGRSSRRSCRRSPG